MTFKAEYNVSLTQKVSVPIIHDSTNDEPDKETFTLTLSEAGVVRRERPSDREHDSATGTIIDNDGPADVECGRRERDRGFNDLTFKVKLSSTMALADMTVKYEILVGEGDTAAESNDFAFSDEYPMSGTLVFEHGTQWTDAEAEKRRILWCRSVFVPTVDDGRR